MTFLADRIAALSGWRLMLAGATLGALATAALPPWNLVPLLLAAIPGLLFLTAGKTPKHAALVGWSFGVGFFASGLYWVGEAMLVDAARHAWLIPFAVGGLAGGLALFPAAALGLLAEGERRGWIAGPAARLLAFAALWTLAEMLRGWVFTGFPWHLLGYAWSDFAAPRQAASLFGVYGLSLVTAVVAGVPTLWRSGRGLALAALVLAALGWGWGELRLAAATPPESGPLLRLVQGNIDQRIRWQPQARLDILRTYLRLSRLGERIPAAIVWPETAVPYALGDDEATRQAVMRELPQGARLIAGVQRVEVMPWDERRFHNSVVALSPAGAVEAVYDKAHLVPFGEYVPLRGILPFERLVPGIGDFTPGPGRKTWRVEGLPPVSPLVCYEAIFPGETVDAADRPAWLLNVTNDGWFGHSAGPPQHLAIARMRAVEEGLPLIRVANTGISAAIDAYGRSLGEIPLGQEGALDVALPSALADPPLFARLGNGLAAGIAAAALALALALSRRPG